MIVYIDDPFIVAYFQAENQKKKFSELRFLQHQGIQDGRKSWGKVGRSGQNVTCVVARGWGNNVKYLLTIFGQ